MTDIRPALTWEQSIRPALDDAGIAHEWDAEARQYNLFDHDGCNYYWLTPLDEADNSWWFHAPLPRRGVSVGITFTLNEEADVVYAHEQFHEALRQTHMNDRAAWSAK